MREKNIYNRGKRFIILKSIRKKKTAEVNCSVWQDNHNSKELINAVNFSCALLFGDNTFLFIAIER